MDLNCLLHRHQVALMRADTAGTPDRRREHRDHARGIAGRIHELRLSAGATGRLVAA